MRHLRKVSFFILYFSFFIFVFGFFIEKNKNLQHQYESSSDELIYTDQSDDCDMIFSESPYKDIKKVALTFDDGPNVSTTPRLLDGLRERGIKATFFVVGENADNNKEIIKTMYEDGHLIGNHTNTHCNLAGLSCTEAKNEINLANNVIKEITGSNADYIRPPFGECGKQLDSELNMFKVLWDIDPRDWSVLNTRSVVNYVTAHTEDGDIILLHDIFDTSVDAALEITDILTERGFEFVTVEEIFFP